VALQVRLLDRKTQEAKEDSGLVGVNQAIRAGNPVIPVGVPIHVAKLAPGAYRLEVTAKDALNNSKTRTADFDVE
jgi:hypothetical protein